MPSLYIIAGCNGAGKTTASFTLLPEVLKIKEFVNADEIARGLSPFQPEKVSIQAGKIMLQRIDELLRNNISFAIETTLSSKGYIRMIDTAKKKGYILTIIFLWLDSPELAIERVAGRVKSGGHNIPENTIRRRYNTGIKNLLNFYIPLANECVVYDNSTAQLEIIASFAQENSIFNLAKWKKIKKYE